MKKILLNNYLWIVWLGATLALAAFYANALVGDDQSVFLPGETTSGHYQIEMACSVCHTEEYGGKEALQKACVKCHKKELKQVEDSHPKSKFTDPRNADRIEILDARYCVTCHVEHKPEQTLAMGVTLPEDYCYLCHKDVAKNRPSHKDMPFDSCDDAGCHNYHDNKALYEEFLVKHMDEPNQLEQQKNPVKNLKKFFQAKNSKTAESLSFSDAEILPETTINNRIVIQWERSAHAQSSVNCTSCHNKFESWTNQPAVKKCTECHDLESAGFMESRHGMKLSQLKVEMSPKLGRLSFTEKSHLEIVDCNTCHTDHLYNTRKAAVDACLACHNDEHSKEYKKSKHYQAWLLEEAAVGNQNSGVSCATCHMPRLEKVQHGIKRVLVDHNQNNTLRPNEKMVRAVCMNCHGLKFSLESLADKKLVKNNFQGTSSVENKGFDLAKKREELKRLGLIKPDKPS